MNDINNTKDKKDVERIKNLVDDPKVVMLSTRLDKIPSSVCPMTIQEIDEQGDIWFFSSKKSSHFKDIEFDNRVQIMYLDNTNQKYISIYGNATHVVDKYKVDELWNPMLENWFEGKNDPDLILLNVNIDNAYYWNVKENKLISILKMVNGGLNYNTSNYERKGFINL